MPSPDVRSYVDLTIYDKDAQTLYETAMARVQSLLEDWEPREGNVETVMLEAFAYTVSELLFAVNRLPGGMLEILLQLFDVYRDYGQQPIIDVVFTAMDDTGGVAPPTPNGNGGDGGESIEPAQPPGYVVPAGTTLLLTTEDGVLPLVFTTDADVVIPPGSRTNPLVEQPDGSFYHCTATCTEFSVNANPSSDGSITPVGAWLSIMDSFTYLNSAQIVGIVREGRIEEDDTEYFARASQVLASMSVALCLPSQFEAECIQDPAVYRVLALDDYNPPNVDDFRGGTGMATNRPGMNAGHITVAVWGPNGQLGDQDIADLSRILAVKSQLNLATHIIDAEINAIDVTTTVIADQFADPDVVRTSVDQVVRAFLSVDSWDWSLLVRRNAVISVIGNAPGVAYVQSLTINHAVSGILPDINGDIRLIGTYRDDGLAIAPLAVARNVNINVVVPTPTSVSWAGVTTS